MLSSSLNLIFIQGCVIEEHNVLCSSGLRATFETHAKYYSTAGIPVALLLIVQYHKPTILQRFYVNCSKLVDGLINQTIGIYI